MAQVQLVSLSPPTMHTELEFVMRECHCDESRARKLLAISKNDPVKAVSHQQRLSAVLARQGHSRAQSQQSTPVQEAKFIPSSYGPNPNTSPVSSRGQDDLNGEPLATSLQDNPIPGLSPTFKANIPTASTIVGLEEPHVETQNPIPPESRDADKSQEWSFQLPQLPEAEVAEIFLIASGDIAASQAQGIAEGETPVFNLRELCVAVQQGATFPAIQRYLQGFPDCVIRARINGTVEGIPSVFYVVEANDPALLRLWASYGADICAIHPASGTPLLAYAIVLSEQLEGRDTSALVATLLSLGASPKSIPDDFYKQFNRDLSEDELLQNISGLDGPENEDSATMRQEWQWCRSPEVRKMLARTANLTQRYYLDRATKLRRAGIRHRQVAALRGAEAVLGMPYFLIGQTIASNHLLRKLMTSITVPSKRPLVLAFAGPSGHGKTELARKLGDLLGLGLQVVDCTIFNEERELFGPRAPYVGSERGSPLNNFIAHNAGRRSVVFLDEFEKASQKIHQSLLLPFDSGHYQDRRTLGTVDCSRTIWILATNALDETILQFCSANPAILQQGSGDAGDVHHTTRHHLAKKLSRELRAAFLDRFGAPITGRVSDFIPFLPFSKGEQAVVAHKFLLGLAERVATPVRLQQVSEDEQLLGNVRLRVRRDAGVCAQLAAAEYSEELGARSLRKAVDDVQDRLVESYLEDEHEIDAGEGVSKAEFVVDVRADEIVVHKQAGKSCQ